MDNAVHWCDCGLGEVMMSEFYGVRDLGRLVQFFHNCLAPVVLECYTNIPASCTAEVPRVACPNLFVCNSVAAEGFDWCSVIFELAVEVRPC